MSTRWLLAAAALSLSSICASCSKSGPGLYPVYGTVTYKGQPAEGAILYFHQQSGSSGSPQGLIPSGVVDSAGKFALDSGDLGSGAPAGKYAVLVQWPDAEVSQAEAAEASAKTSAAKSVEKLKARRMKLDKIPSDRLKGRYTAKDRPLLTAEVKAETNNLPEFELQDGPAPAEEKKESRRSRVTEDRG